MGTNYRGLKKISLKYILAIVALVIGLVIVRVSINGVGIIRENIVSCMPEELLDMFDREQAMICSDIQSSKSALLTGISLGGSLVVASIVVFLVGVIRIIVRKGSDQTSLPA